MNDWIKQRFLRGLPNAVLRGLDGVTYVQQEEGACVGYGWKPPIQFGPVPPRSPESLNDFMERERMLQKIRERSDDYLKQHIFGPDLHEALPNWTKPGHPDNDELHEYIGAQPNSWSAVHDERRREYTVEDFLSNPPDVVKYGATMHISHEAMFGIPEPTEAELAARAARDREEERLRRELLDKLAAADPALQPIIKLHSEDKWHGCEGCDAGYGSEESAPWPCSTIRLIAGIED